MSRNIMTADPLVLRELWARGAVSRSQLQRVFLMRGLDLPSVAYASVSAMDARGQLRECGLCGKNIRVDSQGNFVKHTNDYGATCPASGKYAGE